MPKETPNNIISKQNIAIGVTTLAVVTLALCKPATVGDLLQFRNCTAARDFVENPVTDEELLAATECTCHEHEGEPDCYINNPMDAWRHAGDRSREMRRKIRGDCSDVLWPALGETFVKLASRDCDETGTPIMLDWDVSFDQEPGTGTTTITQHKP